MKKAQIFKTDNTIDAEAIAEALLRGANLILQEKHIVKLASKRRGSNVQDPKDPCWSLYNDREVSFLHFDDSPGKRKITASSLQCNEEKKETVYDLAYDLAAVISEDDFSESNTSAADQYPSLSERRV